MKTKNVDLLHGNILSSLSLLAFPIMMTSLIQMAYNLTDMIWIGNLGSNAVAAVGASGMLLWLGNGLVILAKMGGQIKMGHALGASNKEEAINYAQTSKQMVMILAILYGAICILFSGPLIDFFKLNNIETYEAARNYLIITGGLIGFNYLNTYFTGMLTAMGNSRICFIVTFIGLGLNIILDPLLIHGFLFIPSLGVEGAAIATILAQIVVFISFNILAVRKNEILNKVKIFTKFSFNKAFEIFKLGLPIALESMIFAFISMIIARIVAGYGDGAIAVQKVGSQIESVSWMIGEGYAMAVNSFVAQNYGAKNYKRILDGTKTSYIIIVIWGLLTSFLLYFGAEPIFRIFIKENDVLLIGIKYLKILGISQVFMCVEIISAGCFNGLGHTLPPFLVSFGLTAFRIPLALLLVNYFDIDGVWLAITISSILKGIILSIWLAIYYRKNILVNALS